MKNIFLTISVIALLVSCNKDMQNKPSPIHPDPLFLSDKIKSMIPKEYQFAKYVVFKNASYQYKNLKIEYLDYNQTKLFDNGKYDSESIYIKLSDSSESRYFVTIGASATYSAKNKSFQHISVVLKNTINNGRVADVILDENEQPLWGYLLASQNLLDKEFYSVYWDNIETISFSEIFYTIKEGVVGFRDINNELWVLEKFE